MHVLSSSAIHNQAGDAVWGERAKDNQRLDDGVRRAQPSGTTNPFVCREFSSTRQTSDRTLRIADNDIVSYHCTLALKMRSPALKPAPLDASSSAPSSPGPTSPAFTSPKPDPSYKLPITWFNGEVVARPKTSVWQSLKGKGKLVATQRGEKEDGTGVIAWDSSLAKWDWYLKARCVIFISAFFR